MDASREVRGLLVDSPGSRGVYTGPVRLVESVQDLENVRPGEVIVCPSTNLVTGVLSIIGALVIESGGVLSNPAILARELKIPAVFAVSCATSVLVDGQVVTVDASAGVVKY